MLKLFVKGPQGRDGYPGQKGYKGDPGEDVK